MLKGVNLNYTSQNVRAREANAATLEEINNDIKISNAINGIQKRVDAKKAHEVEIPNIDDVLRSVRNDLLKKGNNIDDIKKPSDYYSEMMDMMDSMPLEIPEALKPRDMQENPFKANN